MFEVIEKEMMYRKQNDMQPGFESLVACKPVLAIGAATPLEGQEVMEDGFRKSLSPLSVYIHPLHALYRIKVVVGEKKQLIKIYLCNRW